VQPMRGVCACRMKHAVGIIGADTGCTAAASQYPAQPSIHKVTEDAGNVTGLLNNGVTTDANRPTLSGTAEPGSTISINDNGFPVPTFPPIVPDADGNWSLTPPLALPHCHHVFATPPPHYPGTHAHPLPLP
ncbi:hypothetical protein, partial [Salmonella enterica]|uniref:hypothetical protein n=1 Tax=Salmonella enterica TaxID=28901 RepID=UPI00398C430B